MSLSAEQLDGNHWLARKLARMEKLEKIEAAARSFVEFLSANAGTNADWPIEIRFGLDVAEPLLLSINALDRALASASRIAADQPPEVNASPTPELSTLPVGTALDRPTILAIRLRVIKMYEDMDARAEKCSREGLGEELVTSLCTQARGMRQVRQMLGRMLDEQAGIVPAAAITNAKEDAR